MNDSQVFVIAVSRMKKAPAYWAECGNSNGMGPKAIDLYRRFGVFPIGDTGSPGGGTWPWWYHTDEATERKWQEDPTEWYEGYFTHTAERVADIARLAADDTQKVTDHFEPRMSGQSMIPIIESIVCDIPRVQIVNIPNAGELLPGVPEDFEVEVSTLVSKRGVQGIRSTGLPESLLAYILHDRVAAGESGVGSLRTGQQRAVAPTGAHGSVVPFRSPGPRLPGRDSRSSLSHSDEGALSIGRPTAIR